MKRSFKAKTGCVTISTGSQYDFNSRSVHGRKVSFKVCTMRNGVSIVRLGRRGGARRPYAQSGGMTACSARGQASKCVQGTSMIVFPGGGGKLRRGGTQVFNGYSKRRSSRRR
jgi:hypothetical protein